MTADTRLPASCVFPSEPMHEHVCVLCSQGDICMYPHKHLGLLYELVLQVWECGRRRPLACQYVLMLHIWFPNFPFSPAALPVAPLHRDVRTLFCFFRVMEGMSDEWWPWMQDITFPTLLFLSLVIGFLLFLFSRALTQALTWLFTEHRSQSAATSAKQKWRHHPPLHSSRWFPFHDAVSKHPFVMSGAVTQKAKAKPRKMGGKSFPAVPLTNLSAALRLCASHASRVAATSKVSFTMNTEGDVFYVYVKRQFVSTVISADECLWIFLEVLCCLGARCMIKAICKAKCVTLMCNRCPRDPRNIKLKGHTDGGNMYKRRIYSLLFLVSLVVSRSWISFCRASCHHPDGRLMLRVPVFSLGNWSRCRQKES